MTVAAFVLALLALLGDVLVMLSLRKRRIRWSFEIDRNGHERTDP